MHTPKILPHVVKKVIGVLNWIIAKIRVFFITSNPRIMHGSLFVGKRNIIDIYDNALLTLGDNFTTDRDVEIVSYSGNIIFGNNCYVGHGSTIAGRHLIEIGDNTMVADLVSIRDHNHGYAKDKPVQECEGVVKSIKIGKNCWLGSKVTIVAGVTLGDNVIVGANSVVTKNFSSNLVIAGVPAKIIKQII